MESNWVFISVRTFRLSSSTEIKTSFSLCLQNVGEREKGEIKNKKFKREQETRNLNVSGKCSKSTLGYLKTSFRPLVGFFATMATVALLYYYAIAIALRSYVVEFRGG